MAPIGPWPRLEGNDMWHTFEGRVLFYTAKAFMFMSHYWAGPLFFPISQAQIEPDGEDTHVVKIKSWLCEKSDIQEFTEYDEKAIEDRTYNG